MDPVSIDFDRLFENVSTESRELLSAALNESCPSFVKLLQVSCLHYIYGNIYKLTFFSDMHYFRI